VCDERHGVCVPWDGGAPGRDSGPGGIDGGEPGLDGASPDRSGGFDGGPIGVDGGPGIDAPPPPGTACDGPLGDRLFCDGFESGDTSEWDGTDNDGFGSTVVVDDIVYMGDYALRVEGEPGAWYGGAGKEVFPVVGITDQWLRAYYYFPDANGFGAEVNSMGEYDASYDVVVSVGRGYTNFHTHSWDTDSSADGSMAIAADTWTCIELHVHFGVTDGAIELFFDDELVAEARDTDTTVPRGLPTIVAGFAWKDGDDHVVTYVDEVVADTSRVGCD
jgi:hypothetical protein